MLLMILLLLAMAVLALVSWLAKGVEGQTLRAEMQRMEMELAEFERLIKASHRQ